MECGESVVVFLGRCVAKKAIGFARFGVEGGE